MTLDALAALVRADGPLFLIDDRTGEVTEMTASRYMSITWPSERTTHVRFTLRDALAVQARIDSRIRPC